MLCEIVRTGCSSGEDLYTVEIQDGSKVIELLCTDRLHAEALKLALHALTLACFDDENLEY